MVALAEHATEPGVGAVGERGGLPCVRIVRGAVTLSRAAVAAAAASGRPRGTGAGRRGSDDRAWHPFCLAGDPAPETSNPQFGRCNAPRPGGRARHPRAPPQEIRGSARCRNDPAVAERRATRRDPCRSGSRVAGRRGAAVRPPCEHTGRRRESDSRHWCGCALICATPCTRTSTSRRGRSSMPCKGTTAFGSKRRSSTTGRSERSRSRADAANSSWSTWTCQRSSVATRTASPR